MPFLSRIIEFILLFLPLLATSLGFGALLWGAHWFFIARQTDIGSERMFPRQLIMMGLTLACVVALVFALPVSESSRNQIIWLIGLVVSGILAFSSGNILANFMAGILLRVTRPFRIGDFIYVREYFGRVAERGLFDTEIQSENRELIAIPNTYLISNPVSTVRTSGAIISVSLSLGYDIHHSKIEPLLIKAAEKSGLSGPFVHVLELGNYSITYRVSGILSEDKWLITARSNLHLAVLDMLHCHGIEIVSPTFMNQRQMPEGRWFIPTPEMAKQSGKAPAAEEILFDKAEKAEQADKGKKDLMDNIHQLEKRLKEVPDEEKKSIKEEIADARERLKVFEQAEIESIESDNKAE